MKKNILKLLLAIVAIIGGATGIYFASRPKTQATPLVPKNPESHARETQPVPKIPFTDITQKAGIKFRHVSGARGHKLLPETMGAGVAFIDFDNDGKQDLLLINSCPWPGDGAPPPTMA